MRTIQVSDEIYAALEARATGFGATPSSVIAELLSATPAPRQLPIPELTDSQPHPLIALIESPEYSASGAKDRYFKVIKFLYAEQKDKDNLQVLLSYSRGTRVNFAKDPRTIEESGTETKPQRLEETSLYIMTNLNNSDKRAILQDVLSRYSYPLEIIRKVVASIPDSGISRPKRVHPSGLL